MSFCDNRNGNFLEKNTHQAIFLEKNISSDIFYRLGSFILKGIRNYQDEGLFKVSTKVKNSECI